LRYIHFKLIRASIVAADRMQVHNAYRESIVVTPVLQ